MSNLKQPPDFDPSGGDSYAEWKNDLEVWRMFTKEEKKRQGPALYLCLKGEAREAVRSIPVASLPKDDGVDTIIAKLDEIFLQDETTRAFCAFGNFVEYRRSSGETYTKFILEYDKRYRDVKKHGLELNDKVQAYFLLKAANLSSDHERLVRTTATLVVVDMKEKLQKVFGEFTSEDTSTLPIKNEDCFYSSGSTRSSEFQSNRHRGRGRGFSYRGGNYNNYNNRGSFRGSGNGGSGRSKGNPLDADGNMMRCHECDSTRHFAFDCPHRKNLSSSKEEAHVTVHLTLVAGSGGKEQQVMLAETLGKGILDSACTKTVAGSTWMTEYLSMLCDKEKIKVGKTEKPSISMYRFGDGKESRSEKLLTIPLSIGGKNITMEVDVVSNDIPLLISKPSMTKLGMIVDFGNHIATMSNGKLLKLKCNSAGHYTIPVCEWTNENCNVVLHLEHLQQLSKEEKEKKAKKIHRQFAHASKERLVRLLKNGGCKDKEFIQIVERVCDNCGFCIMYRRPKLRPIVALPKADRFNQVVAMDLKEVEKGKVWILHLVDTATRYTSACLINTKRKEVVVTKLFQIWLAYFGSPSKFHNDCGGEFCNEVLREMCEKFDIEAGTTPGESPFSNGIVERNNAILYESMMKTKEDANCSLEMALAWAVSAKNALQNVHGYSPNQLVFGRNVNLPTVISSELPALDTKCSSDLVRENLDAMHKARENFVRAESSDKIMKSLRHNVRTYSEEEYIAGDKVLYQARRGRKGWRGPAKVIGKDNNYILIRHGNTHYRCHPCQLTKTKDNIANKGFQKHKKVTGFDNHKINEVPQTQSVRNKRSVHFEDTDSDEESIENNNDEVEADNDEVEADNDEVEADNDKVEANNDEVEADNDEVEADNDEVEADYDKVEANKGDGGVDKDRDQDAVESDNSEDDNEVEGVEVDIDVSKSIETQNERLFDASKRPKSNETIQFMMHNGEIKHAKVLSYQPKRSGTSRNWLNVKLKGADDPSSVDWETIQWWRIINEPAQVLLLTSTSELEQDIVTAKIKEMENLEENEVFEWVDNEGQKAVTSKWVITEKQNDDGRKKLKARLVARGFEENKTEYRTDSPTCSKQALRLVFAVASTESWELHSLDISAAFLQGNKINRNVFIRPPKEYNADGKLWKLKRCLYGLADAPREWYNRVRQELTNLGGIVSLYDNSMFLWFNDKKLVGLLVSHVDDFVYCGTCEWHNKVINTLTTTFKISKQEKGSFKYLGLNLEQCGDEIYVDQDTYIQEIEEIKIDCKRKLLLDDTTNDDEKAKLRSVGGQLLWATTQTRPDVSYGSCKVANFGKNSTVRSLVETNRVIKHLKSEKVRLMFPNLGNPELMEIVVYADASHANLPNGASQGAWLVFISGNKRISLIEWRSKKLERITRSPIASEASALADAADAGWLIANMLKEIFSLTVMPKVKCYSDSKSLKDHLNSSNIIQDPRLRVDAGRLRQMVTRNEIDVKWIPGKYQLADSLTKNGASTKDLLEVLHQGTL